MAEARTWPEVLTRLIQGHDLDTDTARWAMDQVLAGDATPVQIAGFAVALRAKGETAEEVGGLADAMLGRAVQLAAETGNDDATDRLSRVVDIDDAGTGRVRLKNRIDKLDEMALDTASTKTTRVKR